MERAAAERGTCTQCGTQFEWYKLLAYPTPKTSTLRMLGPTAVLGVLWSASPAVLGILLVWYLGPISEWLDSHGVAGWFLYVVVFMFSAGIGFLPTYGQSILGGWTFKFAAGFPGAMLGFVGGSIIGYYIAKSVSRHRVEAALEANPKAKAVRQALIGRGFWKTFGLVTLIRIPPNSPFALTNLVLASSGVRLLPYILGTAIGMAPRTGIAVFVAYFARFESDPPKRDIQELLKETPWWMTAASIGLMMAVLMLIGWMANRAIARVTGTGGPAVAPTGNPPVAPVN